MTSGSNFIARARARLVASGKATLLRIRQAEARRKQQQLVGCYVAVTGSCGKTTTTAFTGLLLGAYGTSVTGLHNVGMTLLRTLRKLRGPADYVVQETSGHTPGALNVTLDALRVDVAVVTSVGFDHATSFRFPDMDVRAAIAREKGRLVEGVAPGGVACLNFDDPHVRAMASRTGERVVGFGLSPDAEVRAINVDARWPGRLRFDLAIGDRTWPVQTRFVGTMMLTNLLGALSVVHGLGLPLEPAIARLAAEGPLWDRMGIHVGRDGKTYIVDVEKAPYWSTEMLVDDLPRMAIPDLTFVIGDISDIRGNSGAQYRKLLRVLAGRATTLVLAGRAAEYGARLAEDGVDNLVLAPTAFDVSRYLDSRPPGVVFLKANKTSQLWRVLDQVTPVGEVADA